MQWIDTHVHIFSGDKSANEGVPLLHDNDALNTADEYLKALGENKPAGIVVVDFSKSKNSEHVIASLDDLKARGVKAAGVIKADINDLRTFEWIKRADVKGVRLYANITTDLSADAEKWNKLFSEVINGKKHVLVFGSGSQLLNLVRQIPEDATILIDHLGLPDLAGEDANFNSLLELAKERGNIFFKGPGYRTSLDLNIVRPIVKKIAGYVGVDHIILGASDGPFAGPVLNPSSENEGKNFGEVINYPKVLKYIEGLASGVSNDDSDKKKMFFENANRIYGF